MRQKGRRAENGKRKISGKKNKGGRRGCWSGWSASGEGKTRSKTGMAEYKYEDTDE